MEQFRNVGIIGRLGSAQVLDTIRRLKNFLIARQLHVILEDSIAEVLPGHGLQTSSRKLLGEICDLVIVVGGDGSLLGAARVLAQHKVPVLGINRGSLGFLTDISPDELELKVGEVLDGKYLTETRFLLAAEVRRHNETIGQGDALNDVVLHPGKSTRMIEFELYIDGQFVCSQKADGLIVATPTGSTAYALSAGGPIMHPKLDAIVIVPMYPHTLSSRPIVVDGNSELKVVVSKDLQIYPLVSCDGQNHFTCAPGDTITICKKPQKLTLIHPLDHNFYEACRTKLGWGSRLGRQRLMLLDPQRSYDLIGDVHGCAHSLQHLLERLGYRVQAGVWRHPWRMAVFLGDIIDRGPRIREALHLVHSMVDAGQALCLMGNHEFNALGWQTPVLGAGAPRYVREHTPLHARQLQQTHEQFAAYPADWREFTQWFQQLPLFVDAQRFRVVHACWDAAMIAQLQLDYPHGCIDQAFVQAAADPSSFAGRVFNRLLRGTDMRLPDGLTLTGDDGYTRAHFRTKFWADAPQTYGDIVFQPDALPEHVAQRPLSLEQKQRLLHYPLDQPLLFIGHYWRRGQPAPIQANLACLDYSAVLSGKLVAYRLDQERQLEPSKFCWVEVDRPEAPL